MKLKSKFLIPIISLFACALLIGTTYSAWVYNSSKTANNTAEVEIPSWQFNHDSDFARLRDGETYTCENVVATQERGILRGSSYEAVRLTNETGTDTGKNHSIILKTDRDYLLSEIHTMKVEFDYYHGKKREQYNNGLPSVELYSNNSKKGNTQGGGNTLASVNSKSVYFATDIGDDWWHLEFFITALCPPYSCPEYNNNTVPSPSTKINGIKISDKNIINFGSTTAFVVIDNLRFSSTLSPRLGLFNKGTTLSVGDKYWIKIAWAGELAGGYNGVAYSFSDPTIIEQDPDQTRSPFYLYATGAGTVTVTATLTIVDGDSFQYLSIVVTLTIS